MDELFIALFCVSRGPQFKSWQGHFFPVKIVDEERKLLMVPLFNQIGPAVW
jgi:hypothetical protein